MQLSHKIKSIPSSPTLEIDAKAKSLINQGIDIVNLSIGEPYFNTVNEASLEGIKAITTNFTKYTPASGIVELKNAIITKLKKENNLSYELDEIIVSNGAKQALYNVFMTVLNPGDEVLIPTPFWLSYPQQVELAEGKSVYLQTDESTNFKITPKQLESAITDKTKALLLNYPNNPTGVTYSKEEILALSKVMEKYDFYIICDEIYEKLIYEGTHFSLAATSEAIKKRTIVINGFSKAFAMTGWRLGYAAADSSIIKLMSSLQSQVTGSISSIAQKAGSVALDKFNPLVLEDYHKKLEYVCNRLEKMPYINFIKPQGAFYIFPNIENIIGKKYKNVYIDTNEKLCELLLNFAKISVVPGIVFGSTNNIRLSFSTSFDNLEKAMNRLEEFLYDLQ